MPLSYIIQVILDEIIIVLYLKYHLQDIYERYWDLDKNDVKTDNPPRAL